MLENADDNALDNVFPTISILQIAQDDLNTAITATQSGKTKATCFFCILHVTV